MGLAEIISDRSAYLDPGLGQNLVLGRDTKLCLAPKHLTLLAGDLGKLITKA